MNSIAANSFRESDSVPFVVLFTPYDDASLVGSSSGTSDSFAGGTVERPGETLRTRAGAMQLRRGAAAAGAMAERP